MILNRSRTLNALDIGYKVLRKKYLDLNISYLAKMDVMCLLKSNRSSFPEWQMLKKLPLT